MVEEVDLESCHNSALNSQTLTFASLDWTGTFSLSGIYDAELKRRNACMTKSAKCLKEQADLIGRSQLTQILPIINLLSQVISQLFLAREYNMWSIMSLIRADESQFETKLWTKRALMYIFEYLLSVRALAYGTIFLLIDDFALLEQAVDDEALRQFVAYLEDLVHTCTCSQNGRIILKILIMTPGEHSKAMAAADPADVLCIKSEPGKHDDPMAGNNDGWRFRELATEQLGKTLQRPY